MAGACASLRRHDTQHRPASDGDAACPTRLAGRSIVLVGLMGAGKTSIGRRLAARLGLPFRDADAEIELAAGCTVPELFARYGEAEFRDGERRVIRRLLAGRAAGAGDRRRRLHGPGNPRRDRATRRSRSGCAATLPTLVRRVAGRDHRPLLRGGDPAEILRDLMDKRHPVYAEADVVVDCGDEAPDATTSQRARRAAGLAPPRRADGGAAAAPATTW